MSIGENLKCLRLERGFTQKQLADELEVTVGMICQIERGSRSISLPLAHKATEVLNCSLYDLFDENA